MKIRSGALVVLALLAVTQTRCSPTKQGVMRMHTFVDVNQNGRPDEGDEMLAGVQLAYGGFGSQPSNEGGSASFMVHLGDAETCLYLNEQKPISVLPPPGYVLKDMEVGSWNCELGWGSNFTITEEDNQAYLRFEKPAAVIPTPTTAPVPPTLTPIPTPLPVATATLASQPRPALSIEAKTTPATFTHAGVLIKFSYRFTNTGNVTLHGPFILKDTTSDPGSIICSQYLETAVLEPGQFIDCGGTRQARPPDLNQGAVGTVITISVTYVDPLSKSSFPVSAEAQTGSAYIKP